MLAACLLVINFQLDTKNKTDAPVKVGLFVSYFTDQIDSSFFTIEANGRVGHVLENSTEKYNEGKIEYSLNNGQKSNLIGRYSGSIKGDYELIIRSVDSFQLIRATD